MAKTMDKEVAVFMDAANDGDPKLVMEIYNEFYNKSQTLPYEKIQFQKKM